jgi:hypothetical protein
MCDEFHSADGQCYITYRRECEFAARVAGGPLPENWNLAGADGNIRRATIKEEAWRRGDTSNLV